MRYGKRFCRAAAVLAGTLGLISASAFVFLQAFQYIDSRSAAASAVSAPEPSSNAEQMVSEGFLSSEREGSAAPSYAAGSNDAEKELVLVNYEHKLPEDYKIDLASVDGIEMDALTARAYRKMRDAAAKDGISLWVSSGYRSDERQGELFDQEVEAFEKTASTLEEAEAFAERSVARPGYSEHCTGLAVDLNGVLDSFDQTDAFRWLDEHAQEYGFILRYPEEKQEITKIKYEPWHYRYVGTENAEIMKETNLCLEEYLDSIGKTGSEN